MDTFKIPVVRAFCRLMLECHYRVFVFAVAACLAFHASGPPCIVSVPPPPLPVLQLFVRLSTLRPHSEGAATKPRDESDPSPTRSLFRL